MPDGGFLVKFDNKKPERCFAISLDYDLNEYTVNNKKKRKLPNAKKITIEIKEA